jgi:2-polyprenyl-3-methyl-5-hydroxy-6-metoxy-1,4-benzoquinol methylase
MVADVSPPAKSQPAQPAAQPMAWPEVHDRVAAILEPLPRGPLLDVPAGEGALSARLQKRGFAVQACDLYPDLFLLRDIDVRRGDLSGTLPYRDNEFAYVVCLEGLEHIENPHQAIREFARLLSPGGHLIVSTPNILNVEERAKWLLYGYTSHFKPVSAEHIEEQRQYSRGKHEVALHINAIAYPELRYILEHNGFHVAGIYRDRPKKLLWLYAPLVWLIRLIGRLTPAAKRRARWTADLQSDAILLGGNTLIVHAVKS